MKRIKMYRDSVGKYRWVYWISSDIVGASSQGYSTKADRNANLEEVMGGKLRSAGPGQLVLVRPDRDTSDEVVPAREVEDDETPEMVFDFRSEDDETAADG